MLLVGDVGFFIFSFLQKNIIIIRESVPEKLALATLQTRLDEALKREKEHKKRIAELEKQIKEGGGVPAVC